MRDIALQVARESKRGERNVLREYLQNYILLLMQKTKMNESLYFVGGTALRFLYGIRRYSEDLDFTAGKGWMKSNLKLFSSRIGQELERAGYDVMIISKDQNTVQRIMIRFAGLLDALGLGGRKEQKFSVHLEIDINPPSGWKEERTIVNIHHPVLIRHYDLALRFCRKIGCCFTEAILQGKGYF